jgi:hypothetical protein
MCFRNRRSLRAAKRAWRKSANLKEAIGHLEAQAAPLLKSWAVSEDCPPTARAGLMIHDGPNHRSIEAKAKMPRR